MFQFIEKFQEVKEATRLASNKAASNGNATGATPVTSANASPITSRAATVTDNAPLLEPPAMQTVSCTSPAPTTTTNSTDENSDANRNSHQRSQSLSGLQVR